MTKKLPTLKVAKKLHKQHGSLRAASRNSEYTYYQLQKVLNGLTKRGKPTLAEQTGKTTVNYIDNKTSRSTYADTHGSLKATKKKKNRLPAKGEIHSFIFTCAQNNTKVHKKFYENLLAFKSHLGAELHISRLTYKKAAYKAQNQKKRLYDGDELYYVPEVTPYLSDDRVQVAPGLTWCGDLDILPTAERPLQGLESFTGRGSGIFPHMKQEMESIPTNKDDAAKFNYTTGTVTQRNYIQRKVGQKAEFHHHYGALLVEVDAAGNWYCRQLNADSTGCFYDMDKRVKDGKVETVPLNKKGCRKGYSIYWGDGHDGECDDEMVALAFGPNGFKDEIRPERDFQGDMSTFKSCSPHDSQNIHQLAITRLEGRGSIKADVASASDWLCRMARDYCTTYAVSGNHERWLGRVLKRNDGRVLFDPSNAEFWCQMQAATFAYIAEHREEPNYFVQALEIADVEIPKSVYFLQQDESVVVNPDANGGIECGAYHGDVGPSGTRGTAAGFARLGRKVNIGDKHAATKRDGVCVAGTFSDLKKCPWVHGPTHWSCTQILTYPNGKRALITFWNGKWRA